jgi:hypothetical protein
MVVSSVGLEARVTALARPRSNYKSKLQTRPLVRVDTRNCETKNRNAVMGYRWKPDTKTDWPTYRCHGLQMGAQHQD